MASRDLESRILIKRLRESASRESAEVGGLRAALESKARMVSDLTVKLTEAQKSLDGANKKLVEDVEKMRADHERELQESLDKAEKTKTDAVQAVVREYADSQLKLFGSVHANVRALLESSVSIKEVDEILDDYRNSRRRSALHPPLQETRIVVEGDQGDKVVRKRVGKVFEGLMGE